MNPISGPTFKNPFTQANRSVFCLHLQNGHHLSRHLNNYLFLVPILILILHFSMFLLSVCYLYRFLFTLQVRVLEAFFEQLTHQLSLVCPCTSYFQKFYLNQLNDRLLHSYFLSQFICNQIINQQFVMVSSQKIFIDIFVIFTN